MAASLAAKRCTLFSPVLNFVCQLCGCTSYCRAGGVHSKSAARRQPRRTAGGGPPRERRVPPARAVAEVIREKGPTRVQSRRHLPPYQFPSNRSPPTTPATDTAPREKEEKESPRTSEDKKNVEASRTSSLRRRGEEGDCSPSLGKCPAV
ncbi:unnamed protein product [Pleuronectes platessa]|uniref:Secreted protein n=1 Tax=Pleuronectes platessa TaxID=8262 RepID=A0A9N7Y6L7_PLEPL|nr:unnamed protein product [Pleuronectes platessa]